MGIDANTFLLGTVVVLLAVDRVLNLLRSRGIDLQKIALQIERLDELHARTDDDGVLLVYTRRSLEKAIEDLQAAIRAQTDLLRELTAELRHARSTRVKRTIPPGGD